MSLGQLTTRLLSVLTVGRLSTGVAVAVTGRWEPSRGAQQSFELHADTVRVLGDNDAAVSTPPPSQSPLVNWLTSVRLSHPDITLAKKVSNTRISSDVASSSRATPVQCAAAEVEISRHGTSDQLLCR